jgi:hypothetical protein
MRSATQLFGDAWKVLVANIQVFFLLSVSAAVIITVTMLVLGVEPVQLENEGIPEMNELLFMFCAGIISVITNIAIIKAVAEPSNTQLASLYQFSLSQFPSYLWVTILLAISIVVGFVLLIIPGIFLLVALAFAPLIVVLEGVRGSQALKQSYQYVKGRWFAVFGRYVFLLFMGLLIMLVADTFFGSFERLVDTYAYTFIIGALGVLVTCFTTAFTYHLYTDLKNLTALPE